MIHSSAEKMSTAMFYNLLRKLLSAVLVWWMRCLIFQWCLLKVVLRSSIIANKRGEGGKDSNADDCMKSW